jgi:hypothetical protein
MASGLASLRRWRSRLHYLMIEEGETAEASAFHKTFFISTFGEPVCSRWARPAHIQE